MANQSLSHASRPHMRRGSMIDCKLQPGINIFFSKLYDCQQETDFLAPYTTYSTKWAMTLNFNLLIHNNAWTINLSK